MQLVNSTMVMTSRHLPMTGTNDTNRNRSNDISPGSGHTRTSSDERPRGHGRTPSTEHLMIPSRADTAAQRRHKDPSKDSHNLVTPTPTPRDRGLATRNEDRVDLRPRARKLSSTEVVYPSPEAAKDAFRAERAQNPLHRRAPTPHTSRRSSDVLKRVQSDRSIRSRVSFDSTRSRGSQRSERTFRTDSFDSDIATVEGGHHHFGSTTGIGPAGEAIEVIGLGRKTPRHRTYQAAMLKPALRSTSRLTSRTTLSRQPSRVETPKAAKRDKALPLRPMSYVAPIVDTFSRFTFAVPDSRSGGHSRHASLPATARENTAVHPSSRDHTNLTNTDTTASRSQSRSQSRAASGAQQPNGFRSLFSSLSIGEPTPLLPQRSSRNTSRLRLLLAPADDLYDYLRIAEIPSWDRWPPSAPDQPRSKSIWGNQRAKGLDAMGWEWHRRLQLAEAARMQGRTLTQWEAAGRKWERGVLEFHEENVPVHPIDPDNRWGSQIFALPSDGYDTLEFYDELIHQAEDNGLLSWVTGTLLQTAVSTLHMLRHSSHSFTFHLICAPRPPIASVATSGHKEPTSPSHRPHYLWEGFGTMVLVNKNNDGDRAMVIEIRPPAVVDTNVIKEFARGKGEQWWAFHGETCVGDVGQANLLQAQVYDDCVQNQVYFFAVTNLKYWVFGQFNSNYTRCTVSPVLERKGRNPSIMQCLSAWVIRSVDERPRGAATTPYDQRLHRSNSVSQNDSSPHQHHHQHQHQQQRQDAPPYTEQRRHRPSRPRRPSDDDFSPISNTFPFMGGTQTIFPQQEYSSIGYAGPGSTGLPGYYDLPPPPPAPTPCPFPPQPQSLGMGMNYWPNGQNGFSPAPTPAPGPGHQMPFNMGMSWYSGGLYSWPGMR